MLQEVQEEPRLKQIGDRLFGREFYETEEKESRENFLIKQKAMEVNELAIFLTDGKGKKRIELDKELAYQRGGKMFKPNKLKKYSYEYLDLMLKQEREIEKNGGIGTTPVWKKILFEIERIYYHLQSKNKNKRYLHKKDFNTPNAIQRLSQNIPEKMQQYNKDLYIGKDDKGWFVDSVKNKARTVQQKPEPAETQRVDDLELLAEKEKEDKQIEREIRELQEKRDKNRADIAALKRVIEIKGAK